MSNQEDKNFKEFLKQNSKPIPHSPEDEWSCINQRIQNSSVEKSWLRALVPIVGLLSFIVLFTYVSPMNSQKDGDDNIELAEYMWNSYDSVEKTQLNVDNDLYWSLDL